MPGIADSVGPSLASVIKARDRAGGAAPSLSRILYAAGKAVAASEKGELTGALLSYSAGEVLHYVEGPWRACVGVLVHLEERGLGKGLRVVAASQDATVRRVEAWTHHDLDGGGEDALDLNGDGATQVSLDVSKAVVAFMERSARAGHTSEEALVAPGTILGAAAHDGLTTMAEYLELFHHPVRHLSSAERAWPVPPPSLIVG